MQKPKGSLSFSCSLSVPYGTLHYSFLFYLTSTTKSLSHFLSPHSSRNEFLDIIPKLCTHHCQAWCCVRQNLQRIWGSSAVQSSHLTSMPRNLRISVPDGLRALKPIPSFIVPNSNFPKGFPFYVLTPFTPVLGSLHTALDNLSGWPLCRTPNNKLCGCSVSEISPRVGRLITGHKVYRQGIPPQ